ncbi:MAG: hypothetical protein GY845_27210 [Planctomycetes bacterium]|nr:hypothetical protein [Planctomycetota bacterium]
MKRVIICFAILFFSVAPITAQPKKRKARITQLTLHPANAPEPRDKYSLLLKPEELNNTDAVPLYEKALQSLPNNLDMDQIDKWRKIPTDKLPRRQVKSILQQCDSTLQFLEEASKCKKSDWPYVEEHEIENLIQKLRKYRIFPLLLDLQVSLQIADKQYDEAIKSIQTGIAMSQNFGKSPNLIQGMLGVSFGKFICRQLEEFVQQSDGPNLYWALRELPQPLVDLTEQAMVDSPDMRNRAHLFMSRLDRHIGALQCIEALRINAALHNGIFPNRLSNITAVPVPDNPVKQKPFVYRCTGSNAFLEAPAPRGSTERDLIQYELKFKEGI